MHLPAVYNCRTIHGGWNTSDFVSEFNQAGYIFRNGLVRPRREMEMVNLPRCTILKYINRKREMGRAAFKRKHKNKLCKVRSQYCPNE